MGGNYSNRLIVRLVIIVLVALLPTVGVIVHNALRFKSHEGEESVEALRRSVNEISRQYLHQIQATHALLYSLARMPEVGRADAAACQDLFAGLKGLSRFYDNIGLIGKDGYAFVSAVPFAGVYYLGDRQHVRQAIQSRDFATSKLQMSRILRQPTLVCTYPVLDGSGEAQGVLFANLNLRWLPELMEEARLPSGSDLTITDDKGNLLACYPHPEELIGKTLPPGFLEVVRKEGKGTLEEVGADGVKRLYAFTALGKNPVGYALAGTPVAVAYAAADKALRVDLLIMGVSLTLALGLTWIMGFTTITRPVHKLAQAAGQLGKGDLSARIGSVSGLEEFSRLSHAFNGMAESLQRRETERSQAEAALRESETRFRSVFEQGPLGIAIVGTDYRWIAINPTLCEMVGYTEDELTKLTFVDITHPDDMEANLRYAEKLSRGEIPSYTMEKRYMRKNGGVAWVSMTASTLLDDQERLLYFLVMVEDIAERKLAEQRLAEAHEFNRSILVASPLGIATYRSDGQCVSANEAIASIAGATAEQLVAQNFREIGSWQRSGLLTAAEEVLETGVSRRVEAQFVSTFGKEVWVDCSFSRFTSGGEPFLLLTANDVSELKRVENELRESETRYRKLFDDSRDGVYANTRDGKLLAANKALLDILGYTEEEFMATNAVDLYVDPNDRLRFQDFIERNGYVENHESWLQNLLWALTVRNRARFKCLFF
ncbi:MAG: PAS domain S-box protein [Deltaproteobacteria bacterium]|nr:PAS domain S-box protein [Deltaproteobacteria bacterium]